MGKFDSLRFSDSRTVREESRLFRIVFNSAGYFQFQYYLMKDPKITLIGKVPFDFNAIPQGRESVFAVENPDFVKNIRVKINMKTQRILEVHVLSNLGIQGEFVADVVNNQTPKN